MKTTKKNNKVNMRKSRAPIVVILYLFPILVFIFGIRDLIEQTSIFNGYVLIKNIGCALASASVAVSCSIQYYRTYEDIKTVLTRKTMYILLFIAAYFLFFFLGDYSITNFVISAIVLLISIVLTVPMLFQYFKLQDYGEGLVEKSEEDKIREAQKDNQSGELRIEDDLHE